MLEVCTDLSRDFRRRVVDVGIPSGSLLRGRKKTSLLREFLGDARIETMTAPCSIVAADLISGREVVLSRGPLWQALDATTAIPTIFPTVPYENWELVDGWVVNPFPSDVLHRAGAEVIVGIVPSQDDQAGAKARPASRPRSRLSRWLDPRRLIDPAGIVRVAMRSMDVGARERTLANLSLADVCVRPTLTGLSTTDVNKLEQIVAAGETAAEAALPALRQALSRRIRPHEDL